VTLDPPVTRDCVSDLPFPHDLLVRLTADAFGMTETETVKLALSMGMSRVGNGWVMGDAGNG
jgi:hypothetical protein